MLLFFDETTRAKYCGLYMIQMCCIHDQVGHNISDILYKKQNTVGIDEDIVEKDDDE